MVGMARASSSPHRNKIGQRPSYAPLQRVSSILPLCYEPLRLDQVKSMRWGMNMEIEMVMHKVKVNLLNWNRVILDMKEINLALDENEFEREGGEITWNTEDCIEFEADSDREEDEEVEEVIPAAKETSKIPDELRKVAASLSAIEQLPEVEAIEKGRAKAPVKTQDQIEDASQEQMVIQSIKEINKWMNLDHWTDEEVKRWQDAMMGKVAQRAASNKALDNGKTATVTSPFLKPIVDPEEQRRVAEADMAEYRKKMRPQRQRPAASKILKSGPAKATTGYQQFAIVDFDDDNVRRLAELAEYRKRQMGPQAQRPAPNPVFDFDISRLEGIEFVPFPKSVNEEEIGQLFAQGEEYRKRRGLLGEQYKLEADKVLGTQAAKQLFQGEGMSSEHTIASLLDTYQPVSFGQQIVFAPQSVGTARPVSPPKRVDTPRPFRTARPASSPHQVEIPHSAGISQPVDASKQVGVSQPVHTSRGLALSHAISSSQPGLPQLQVTDPFKGVYPCSGRMLVPGIDNMPKTPEEEETQIEEDVEHYRVALQDRLAELIADANAQIHARRFGDRTEIAAVSWKEKEARMAAEIDARVQEYREMCRATRQWEKGNINLEGLGEAAQKHLAFIECDEAEKIRRAGVSKVRREEIYTSLKSEIVGGASGADLTEKQLAQYDEYEREMAEDYEAEVAAGLEPKAAAKEAAKKQAKKQAAVHDGVEAQIRKVQEAREKRAAAIAKIKEDRALEREAAEAVGGKKAHKTQKKGKSGGRRHKK